MPRSAASGGRGSTGDRDPGSLTEALIDLGRKSGLAAVGVTGVATFTDTRHELVERKARGLAAGMQFTYRNPARSTDPARILPGARALLVGAWNYADGDAPTRVHGGPTGTKAESGSGDRPQGRVARYAARDHYASLRAALRTVAGRLESLGWRAVVVCDDNALVDRAAAHRAGLGWYGKNSLFFVDGLGSWFVIGSIVTDAPLVSGERAEPMPHGRGCGACTRCSAACPTGALSEPGVVDARRCLAWLVQAPGSFPEELRRALGDRLYGCDECQQVCPVNRIAARSRPAGVGSGGEGRVDILGLLAASDEDLMVEHGRWYIADRDPRYLRRNALVVLGNVGDGRDPSTEATLRRWLADGDPMLAEHARWSARALGRDDLVNEAV